MIVIGADTHKQSHTCAAAKAGTGELAGERTAAARKPGFRELLDWGRSLDEQRIWALEDCRHVSGSFERFLVAEGEQVVRVAAEADGQSRKGERARGKSDPIDALAIARAALKGGPETLPAAHLDERALELKLLLDHREDLVRSRAEDQQRLRWHLHDLWPELRLPAGCLDRIVWLAKLARKLSRAEQSARVRIARELVGAIRDRTRRASELEREITALVGAQAPELLELPGCGALTAAKLVAETAGVERFSSDSSSPGSPASPRSRPPRATATAPPRPRRQPPAQLRPAPDRGHPGTRASARCAVPRPQAGRGQIANGGASRPQAPPRSSCLARPSRRPRPRVDQLPLPY